MNVLIIGGTRYMGKVVVEKLLERGDQVTVFSRGTTRPDWWDRVDHVLGDRSNYSDFSTQLQSKQFDAVIDTQAYRWEDVQSAVETFQEGVGRYLLVSTSSVYLEGAVDFFSHCPYDESAVDWSDLEYVYPAGEDPYAVGKRHCEKWLMENAALPYTIIRIPAVMGPDDPTGRMWWWVQRALDGGGLILPTDSLGLFRTLYHADAAVNFVRALDSEHTVNQTYFVGMPEIMSVERWADLIWNAAGHDCHISYVPREVLNKSGSMRTYAPPLTRPLSNIHDLSKAHRLVGLVTTPMEQWIPSTVAWYRDNYHGGDSDGYKLRNEELSLAERWDRAFGELVAEF